MPQIFPFPFPACLAAVAKHKLTTFATQKESRPQEEEGRSKHINKSLKNARFGPMLKAQTHTSHLSAHTKHQFVQYITDDQFYLTKRNFFSYARAV